MFCLTINGKYPPILKSSDIIILKGKAHSFNLAIGFVLCVIFYSVSEFYLFLFRVNFIWGYPKEFLYSFMSNRKSFKHFFFTNCYHFEQTNRWWVSSYLNLASQFVNTFNRLIFQNSPGLRKRKHCATQCVDALCRVKCKQKGDLTVIEKISVTFQI